ncbi:hypothetical protein ACVIW2_002702 [Bradyrhizobium huanghuaihaiense]|nr:hypothetical protein [Bradyrhizobium huanghuaihaiense]
MDDSIQQIEDAIVAVEAGRSSFPDIPADAGSEFAGASKSDLLSLDT